MAQPSFVPVPDADRVRPSIPAPVPTRPRANRPGELRAPTVPTGPGVGATGPDQGYALALARRLRPRLVLASGEDVHDVEVGTALLATRRAALQGRAPCAFDVEVAAGLFGYLSEPPPDLVAYRRARFRGIAHSYDGQRALVDGVPAAALALAPAEAAEVAAWRERLCPTEGHA